MDLTSGTPWETVTLVTLSRDRLLFARLLEDAKLLANAAKVGKTVIYTAWGVEWRPFGQPRARRLLQSVVLDKGVKERIFGDVQSFMARGKWYADRGVLAQSGRPANPKLISAVRHSIPSRLSVAWSAWIWQIIFHSGARRIARVQYSHPQLIRARPHRR